MNEFDEIIEKLIINAKALGEIEGWGESENKTFLINHHQEIVDKCVKQLKEKINHE